MDGLQGREIHFQTAVSAGVTAACAISAGGGVECWGRNDLGQLGNDSTANSLVPVPVSGLASGAAAVSVSNGTACAVTAWGGVECWGNNNYGQLGNNTRTNSPVPVQVMTLTSGVSALSVGYGFACAVARGGVWCWGVRSNVPVHVTGFPG